MYILNNIHDRNYKEVYPEIDNVIFDISEKQLRNSKNSDWDKINNGDLICVVKSSRKISTFYLVKSRERSGLSDQDGGESFVITGTVVAKAIKEEDMTKLFDNMGVAHPYLPANKFSIGFNVANIGDSLDTLTVKSAKGPIALGDLAK